jgi:threonyl-tRNA synthetase
MTTNLVAGRISPIASLAANQETVSKTESEVDVIVEEDEIRPIILPTNESSENLLKIRHTVRKSCCIFLQLLSSSSSISKKKGPVLTF